jgi:hypothetical protein
MQQQLSGKPDDEISVKPPASEGAQPPSVGFSELNEKLEA